MNCHATRRRDQPRRERGEGRARDGGTRKAGSTARDGGTRRIWKFADFLALYRPRYRVRFRWKRTGEEWKREKGRECANNCLTYNGQTTGLSAVSNGIKWEEVSDPH